MPISSADARLLRNSPWIEVLTSGHRVWLIPATLWFIATFVTRLGNVDGSGLTGLGLLADSVRLASPEVALMLMGTSLASVGWCRLWMAPALIKIVGAVGAASVVGVLSGAPVQMVWQIALDELASGWGPLARTGPFARPLLIAVVLLPPVLLLRTRTVPPDRPTLDGADRVAVVASLFLVAMVTFVAATFSQFQTPVVAFVGALAVPVVYGVAIGTARGWWPWAHIAVGYLVGSSSGWPITMRWALGSAVVVSALWVPLSRNIRSLGDKPLQTLIALNVLNVVDALSTRLAIDSGGAVELNPLVTTFGMSAKVLLVAIASFLIFKLKPKMLLLPTFALGLVAVWHLLGLIVNL